MSTGTTAPKGFPALVESRRDELAAILPDGMSADRFVKVARVAYANSPDLAKCDPGTVLLCVMQAAELGLEIGKPLDLAHLVPFGRECTLLIDYKGMLELARRTGAFAAVDARIVYSADTFDLHYDPTPVFMHRPSLDAERGQPTHAYAYARLTSGELQFEIMTAAEVEAIRNGARSGNSPAWKNHWCEMARKVVLKRLLKRLPRSPHLARAVELDDAGYDLDRMTVSTAPRSGSRAAALADRLGAPPALPAPEDDDLPEQGELDADAE
jgi:recombination protein RecT